MDEDRARDIEARLTRLIRTTEAQVKAITELGEMVRGLVARCDEALVEVAPGVYRIPCKAPTRKGWQELTPLVSVYVDGRCPRCGGTIPTCCICSKTAPEEPSAIREGWTRLDNKRGQELMELHYARDGKTLCGLYHDGSRLTPDDPADDDFGGIDCRECYERRVEERGTMQAGG